MITEGVQCFVYIYFCDYSSRATVFYSIILAFQCYRHYLEYAQSKSTVEAMLGKAGRENVKLIAFKLLVYRLIGWLPCTCCFICIFCDKEDEGLKSIQKYGSLTTLSIAFFDFSALLYALAPSYSTVVPFQVVLTSYMWLSSEFVKTPEANDPALLFKSFKAKLKLVLILLALAVVDIYAIVIASPSLQTRTYINGWDEAVCIFAVFGAISVGCYGLLPVLYCMDSLGVVSETLEQFESAFTE